MDRNGLLGWLGIGLVTFCFTSLAGAQYPLATDTSESSPASVEALDYRELYPDLVTPGRFFAVTLPPGVARLQFGSEYFSESYLTEEEDDRGRTHILPAEYYYEWTSAMTLSYGITPRIEVGLLIPWVYSSFDKSSDDDFSNLPQHASEGGLGNVMLLFSSGQSWNDESDSLLLELGLGLPTDTRSNDLFAAGGSGAARLTFEHYWDRFGVVGTILGDYFGDHKYEGGEWSYGYQAGIQLEPADGWFLSVVAGQDDDGDVNTEAFLERILTPTASLEVFGGLDLSGDADEKFIGLGLSFLLGNS